MGRILAIDYGQKRVGIAVTDELQLIAGPLDTVHSGDILEFLKAYLFREKVDCIVVGEPLQMNGTASESAKFIEPFIRSLHNAFPEMEIVREDERFTSKIAGQTLLMSGAKKKDRQDKALIDKVSAVLILQTYLESRNWRKR